MSKHYEVTVTAFAVVLVLDAESEEDALTRACDELRMGDLQMDEGRIRDEVKPDKLAESKRHADYISEP